MLVLLNIVKLPPKYLCLCPLIYALINISQRCLLLWEVVNIVSQQFNCHKQVSVEAQFQVRHLSPPAANSLTSRREQPPDEDSSQITLLLGPLG